MTDNLYFEPPSRLQLVEKMAHVLRFSNAFLLLAGPTGSGVSTVVEQLHTQVVEDDNYILSLVLEGDTNLSALLRLLNSGIDELVQIEEQTEEDELSTLHRKLEHLSQLQRRLLVSIDNSELLSDEAVECLANLLSANAGKIAVVLAGSDHIVKQVGRLGFAKKFEGDLHSEILAPFNRTETEEFLQLRFVRGNDLNSKQIAQIFLNSEGYPGRITAIASQMIKSGKIKLNGKSSFLPLPHMVGITLLLLAIIGVSSWQFMSTDEELIAEQETSTSSLELPLEIALQQVVDPTEKGVTLASKSADLGAIAPQVSLEQQVTQLTDKVSRQQEMLQQGTLGSNKIPLASTETAPLIPGTATSEAVIAEATDFIESNLPQNSTVVAASSVKPIVLKTLANGSQELDLPTDVAALNAVVSQLDLQTKNSAQPASKQGDSGAQTAKKPQVKAPVVAVIKPKANKTNTVKRPTVSPAKGVAKKWLAQEAIEKWPTNSFTLQLLAARSERTIVKFLTSMPNAERMYYYQTTLKGKPWNVIVYGQYATKSAANAAVAGLPAQLKKLKPWVKSIKTVKSTMKK